MWAAVLLQPKLFEGKFVQMEERMINWAKVKQIELYNLFRTGDLVCC